FADSLPKARSCNPAVGAIDSATSSILDSRGMIRPLESVTAPAYPPTNAIFHDPALLEAEQQRIFAEGWVMVGTADQLPAPNTRFAYDAQGRSLLITRDEKGTLRG